MTKNCTFINHQLLTLEYWLYFMETARFIHYKMYIHRIQPQI